jgi:hypothetical protein
MTPRRYLGLFALAALTLGCGAEAIPAPPAGLAHSAAWPECGPADGPAVLIYLATAPFTTPMPDPPYVAISLWQPVTGLTERSWTVGQGEVDGVATYCSATDDCEVVSTGHVTVTGVDADTSITGTADLTFPAAGRVTGAFSAEWLPLRFFVGSRRCG